MEELGSKDLEYNQEGKVQSDEITLIERFQNLRKTEKSMLNTRMNADSIPNPNFHNTRIFKEK